jgi:hypothetical protein
MTTRLRGKRWVFNDPLRIEVDTDCRDAAAMEL